MRLEEIRCEHAPEASQIDPASAEDAGAALLEEARLNSTTRELALIVRHLWGCIRDHNAKAKAKR